MKIHKATCAAIAIASILCNDVFGRGGGGRGGGGFHGGGNIGGGGYHGGGNFGGGGFGGGGYHGGGNFGGGGFNSRPASSGFSNFNRPGGGGFSEFGNRGGGNFSGFGDRTGPQIGDRPSMANRPGQGGAGTQFRPGENRPGGGVNRPGQGGSGTQRPGGGGNRPDNRPDNNRPNRENNFNQFNNYGHNQINHGDWNHGNWHDNWNRPWNNHPWAWWGAGVATGLAASAIPWSWGYWGYSNPYATAPVVIDNSTIDYSQPIMSAEAPATEDAQQQAGQPSQSDVATQDFDEAREAFKSQDYQTALAKVNQAIALVPNDPTLHEFRALVFFATKQYKDAAAAIYAVLSAGPGWDWTTLSGLYPNVDVYTQQLRALESYCKQYPDQPQPRFLLAYEYLTCGKTDAAATELKVVTKLNPQDQLASQLLAGITGPTEPPAAPSPEEPATPPKPVSAASLAGNWKSKRPDGGSISLDLANDAKYTWKFTQNGKSHDFSGNYTVADNLLILNQENNPAMIGQVTQLEGKGFNFKLPGSSPNDPGLNFSK